MMRDQASAPEATDIGLATYGDVLSASGARLQSVELGCGQSFFFASLSAIKVFVRTLDKVSSLQID